MARFEHRYRSLQCFYDAVPDWGGLARRVIFAYPATQLLVEELAAIHGDEFDRPRISGCSVSPCDAVGDQSATDPAPTACFRVETRRFLLDYRVVSPMTFADRGLGCLLAALIVLSTVPAATVGLAVTPAQQADPTADDDTESLDPADEIYIRDNGSAVLVYNESDDDGESDTQTDIEYGADISSNLFYFLAGEEIDEETDAEGQASVLLTQSNISGNGQLSFDQPEELSTLSFQAVGETTDQNAASNMSLDATFDSEDAGGNQAFESATTTGNVTATGEEYNANATFDMQFEEPPAGTEPASFSFVLTEDGGDYTLDVERNETLSTYETEDWSTREQAQETLERQYVSTASEFDGNATVSIDRYEFADESRDSARLDIAYTVEYTGIEGPVTEALAENISQSEAVDMDEQRAEELTTRMRNLSIERVAMSYEIDDESASASFEADIDNYDDVVLAAAEFAEASETEEFDGSEFEGLDDLTARVESQQAADLTQQTTWSATVDEPSPGQVSVSAEANYTTENWDDYVTELNSRGVETYNTSYAASAETTADDRINMTASLTVDGDLFEAVSSQVLNASEAEDDETPYVVSFLQADLQRGQVNVSSDDRTVRVEMGAQFSNLSAFRDSLADNGTVPAGLTGVVGRTENGTTTTYVAVDGAVGADAAESDVRALAYVGDETTVHMPGEWDREFPSMDTDRAASFLGVDLVDDSGNGSTVTPTTGGSGPGFGVGVTLVALLGVALLAGRRY